MKTASQLLLIVAAVVALTGCIDADHPTPQGGKPEVGDKPVGGGK